MQAGGGERRINSRAGGFRTVAPDRAVPMGRQQQGSRLGLGDFFTLTDNQLGLGNESLELRERVLGGA